MKAEEIAPIYMANDTAQFRKMAANPYAAMAELINAFQITQLARVLATFSFAEHLANGPKTAAEIAKAASIDPDAAFRILRFAASYGLVTSEDGVRFSGSPTLATLLKDTPGSLRGLAMTMGGLSVWLPWGRLPDAVRTGKPQTVAALGTDTWSYLSAHPDELADVVAAISGASAAVSAEAARLIDTKGTRLAVDVGGLDGSVVRALMALNPELSGVVLDLPKVVPHARAEIERAGLQDRLSAVGGDFFESVPEADLYLLRYIIHDWDDESCLRILRNVRNGLQAGGRVMVIDAVVGDIGGPPAVPGMDINMMVVLGGRERTIAEFKALFEGAGLRFVKATSMSTPTAIIEAVAS